MPYTGQVSVGGDADVRTVPGLQITKVATPPFENNCYLLRCTETGDTLLIDAAGDAPRLLELVGDGRLIAADAVLVGVGALAAVTSVSITAMGAPTATTCPSCTRISVSTPAWIAGTSVSTLSVATSSTDSSCSIASPTCLSHFRTVPSMMLSPILGIVISTRAIRKEGYWGVSWGGSLGLQR